MDFNIPVMGFLLFMGICCPCSCEVQATNKMVRLIITYIIFETFKKIKITWRKLKIFKGRGMLVLTLLEKSR